jgi:hypothetical protein
MMNLLSWKKESFTIQNQCWEENGYKCFFKITVSNTKTYNFQEIKVILKQILTILNYSGTQANQYLKSVWLVL